MEFGTKVRFKKPFSQGYFCVDEGDVMVVAHYSHKYWVDLNTTADQKPISNLVRIPFQQINDYLEVVIPHPDDLAVEAFAKVMKEKLALSREKGRHGWNDKERCPTGVLQQLLAEHLKKGDPIDVANFAMMIHARGESCMDGVK